MYDATRMQISRSHARNFLQVQHNELVDVYHEISLLCLSTVGRHTELYLGVRADE